MAKENPFKRIFDLYTSDLGYQEIERLIKRDASEVYEYFAHDIPKPDVTKNKFSRALIFLRSLFNAFLLKLSPARRLIYIFTIVIFIVGLVQAINSYVVLSFLIMNILLAFELADKLTVKDDLNTARTIQSRLLPQDKIDLPGYQVATYYESAKEVGGDYYDILDVKDDKHLLVVGDISGKGLAAALYMVRLQAILQFLAESASNPKEILIKLNRMFSKKLSKGYFLTLLLACIDKGGSISIIRAGHTPVLHYIAAEDKFVEHTPKGIGIGLNDGKIFENSVEEINIKPETGDILFFYTDGITELMDDYKRQFGDGYIRNIISGSKDKDVEVIKERINAAVEEFRGRMTGQDDLTYLVFKAD
ncbi:MAG: hypothetical protein SCALA702_17640 [Melioribacteraceae bacterium]|nr:MAG: hypothetical protein SCALA702_17640 [Melioribacteraceae bacterium]